MKINEIVDKAVTLTKGQWETLISTSDKEELGGELVDLVKHAYNNTPEGSFVHSIRDVIPSDWGVIDWDKDPDVDATVFYRAPRSNETWTGYKIQGLGHDGQGNSKTKAVQQIMHMLSQTGCWLEGSDAMRAVLKKSNAPIVTDEKFLQQLFNDRNLRMVADDTYQRRLSNRIITETVFGKPVLK